MNAIPLPIWLNVADALALVALAVWLWPRRRSLVGRDLICLLLALSLYLAGHTWALAGGSPEHIKRVLWVKYSGVCLIPVFYGFLFAELTGWNRYLSRRVRFGMLAWSIARDGLSMVLPIARNSLVEALDDGVLVTDANRMVADANPAARRLLTLPPSLGGRLLADVLQGHPALLERCRHQDADRRTHAPVDGAFWRLTWQPLHSARGKPLGFMLLIHDLSDLQRAELALGRSEARHRLLLDHATDLIWNLDAQGVFTYVSPSWERVLGHPTAAMVGATFQPLIHPDDLPACMEYLQSMVRDCRPNTSPEYRVRHADGSWHWHAANARPVLDAAGQFVSMVGVSRDITQQREAQEERERLLRARTELWQEATQAALGAGEEEARRIGQELHDTLCQDLIGLARRAGELANAGAAGPTPDSPGTAATLRWLADQAVAAARRARDLSHVLAIPASDSGISLNEALAGQLPPLERLYGIACELSLDDALLALPPESAGHLIRIIREAVVNAARHAQAKRVWVDGIRQDSGTVLSISSDGVPVADPATWQAGLGLRQMCMRAGLLNATLTFRRADRGAVVELQMPDPANRDRKTGTSNREL